MLFQWGTFDADTRASREKERRGRTDKRQAAKAKAKAQAIAQVRNGYGILERQLARSYHVTWFVFCALCVESIVRVGCARLRGERGGISGGSGGEQRRAIRTGSLPAN